VYFSLCWDITYSYDQDTCQTSPEVLYLLFSGSLVQVAVHVRYGIPCILEKIGEILDSVFRCSKDDRALCDGKILDEAFTPFPLFVGWFLAIFPGFLRSSSLSHWDLDDVI
jgi:hypothetical protein